MKARLDERRETGILLKASITLRLLIFRIDREAQFLRKKVIAGNENKSLPLVEGAHDNN